MEVHKIKKLNHRIVTLPLKYLFQGAIVLIASGCTSSTTPFLLSSVFWHEYAPEYSANTRAAYVAAGRQVDSALSDPKWTAAIEQETMTALPKKTAVILDVDETVLNNAPFFANLVKTPDFDMRSGWDNWVNSANAKALDGSVKFIKDVLEQGVSVFFVSNRSCEPLRKIL